MKITRRVLSVIFAVVLMLVSIPMSGVNSEFSLMTKSVAAETSGKCGENVFWSYNERTNTVTISGTGDMWLKNKWGYIYYDYNYFSYSKVIIENGVTSIGDYAFRGYYYDGANLTSVTIPNSVTKIGEGAFRYCNKLTSITIPSSVKSIGYGAFEGCSGLINVKLSSGLTEIGEYAFVNCKTLININLPDTVKSIGENAFRGCEILRNISIPKSVSDIGEGAFGRCPNLESFSVDAGNTSYKSDSSGVLLSKDGKTLKQYPTGNSRTKYSIPNGVETIESSAFRDSVEIKTITISNNVKNIGDSAFRDCVNLTTITIPSSVKYIGESAFRGCENIATITVPSGVIEVGENAFKKITNVMYGGTLKDAPWGAKVLNGYVDGIFVYQDSTKKVLADCKADTEGDVVVPAGVEVIGNSAFKKCTEITSIVLPDSVYEVCDSAFCECESMKTIDLGNNKNLQLNYAVFYMCTGLEKIKVGKDCKNYLTDEYGVLYTKDKTGLLLFPSKSPIEKYRVDDNVIYIDTKAFYKTYNLRELYIGKNLMSIQWDCFNWNSVDTIYYAGSEAEWNKIYVDESNYMPYIVCNVKDTPAVGDVNMDGNINSTDALLVLQYTVEQIDLTWKQYELADVNKDDLVNSTDALRILQYVVKQIDHF